MILVKSKKLLSVIIILSAVFLLAFAGCSAGSETETQKENQTETAAQATTDGASISESDAVSIIKSYSTEDLELSGEWSDYGFAGYMKNPYTVEDGDYKGSYIEVRIGNKIEREDGVINFDIAGYYLVSYDGATVLKYDPNSNVYIKLPDPPAGTTDAGGASESHSETTEN